MLTHLHIKNFKAWKDTGPIRLAPLTVLFGANSAGKSSLGHLLLALQQTADCKWLDWWPALRAKGVEVDFLCPADACSFYGKKFPEKPVPRLPR